MEKKKIELIIIGCLVLVFLFTFTNSIARMKPKKTVKAQAPSTGPQSIQRQETLFKIRQEEKVEIEEGKLSWGRDPFVLQGGGGGEIDTAENLKLMGITGGKNTNLVAIINDQLVSIGSKVGKFRILKILPNKVIVTDGEKDYELEMK